MKWERAGQKIQVPLLEYLENLIKEEQILNHKLLVSVGTDSQRYGRSKNYKFATVIMITVKEDIGGVIVGRGGKIISSTYFIPMHGKHKENVNERMLTEVSKSIEVAYEIADLLDSYGIKLEVHADINPDPKWESNKALSQAVGYILGMGYEFKVKPSAWAASYCGDKYAK
jgi:predicted RNase H-related nuclease YkuK (DUF458 family)